ncbi:hypothetical protein [uncultured Fibrobacter sp.]|uniref:hypothetical protein n=1 Tax=uncultured Fibrobacter sp. TaxID=261512 RepID=UPI0025FCC416|nr:hypothetical protein [uncultured Fibrobacter sp.]
MLYKHWKKIAIALTGFFWASCDETASGPVAVNEDTPSSSINENTEGEGGSSSSKAKSAASSETAKSATSSVAAASATSSAKSAASSSSNPSSESHGNAASSTTSAASSESAKSAASSAEEASEESSAESTASSVSSSSSEPASSAKSSSSVKKPRSSNSHLDEPVDLYGCPSDICGPFITDSVTISDSISQIAAKYGVIRPKSSSSSSFSQIVAKYGVIRPESSSSFTQIIAKYGVPNKPTCEPSMSKDGTVTYKCSDGVTCVEETTTGTQAPACNGDVCPKYGVVKISKKTYTCDNGQVYNEAEFQMLYDTLPEIKEIVIHKDSIQAPIALYGPPCVFDGTCNKEK